MARLASAAHGVVTRDALLAAGLTRSEIGHRLRSGALLREHRGVYRVGHRAPSRESRYLAAVLAAGPGSLLAGAAAGHLIALLRGPAPPPEVIAERARTIRGAIVHRRRTGAPPDHTIMLGIPVTTSPRTLVDLAARLTEAELARACHEAGVLHGTTPAMVEAALARRPRSPGAPRLRRVLHGDVAVTLSRLETAFRSRLADAGLPLPRTNRPVGGRRVDCRWPDLGLTVEVDGYRYHRSRHAWEQDRAREREAYARGDDFRRYTYATSSSAPSG